MKVYTYKEIKDLHLQVGSESWAESRMSGRCGVSAKRLKEMKKIRPNIPTDVLLFPKDFVVKPAKKQKTQRRVDERGKIKRIRS